MKLMICALLASAIFPKLIYAQEDQAPSNVKIYVGVDAGYESFDASIDYDDGTYNVSADGLSGDGFTGGIFAGAHLGFGEAFFATEGFVRLSKASASFSASDGVDSLTARISANESYGAAAKLGYRLSRSSGVYGRVGWVNTRFESFLDVGGDRYSADATEDAIEYGVGLESMIARSASLRFEYLRADYGEAGLGEGVEVDSNGFRAGISYRF